MLLEQQEIGVKAAAGSIAGLSDSRKLLGSYTSIVKLEPFIWGIVLDDWNVVASIDGTGMKNRSFELVNMVHLAEGSRYFHMLDTETERCIDFVSLMSVWVEREPFQNEY